MARIARNKVRFRVNDEEWIAVFQHEHARDGDYLLEETKRLRHVTVCALGRVGTKGFSVGEAKCSLKDTYNWRIGIKLSFKRALAVIQITPMESRARYGEFMKEFFTEMSKREAAKEAA